MSGTKRISALTELASGSVDEDDILAIVDMSQAAVIDKTKHVKVKNLIAVGGRLEIDSFAELATKFVGSSPSSTQQIAQTNDIVVWREKGFRYQCVTSGQHFDYTGSGGLKWKVLPGPTGADFLAFGATGNGSTDDATALGIAASSLLPLVCSTGTFYLASNTTFTQIIHFTGGVIKPNSGVTVTIRRHNAGRFQCFDASVAGGAAFVLGSIEQGIYPEWFGARTGALQSDTQPAIQAAVNSAKVSGSYQHGGTYVAGTWVDLAAGEYQVGNPIVLPRNGTTPLLSVPIKGKGSRLTRLRADGPGITFPTERAFIEWEDTNSRAWHQHISGIGFSLPNRDKVRAIWYKLNGSAASRTLTEVNSQWFHIDMEDILVECTNFYHDICIKLEGNVRFSTFKRMMMDPSASGGVTYDTIHFDIDYELQGGAVSVPVGQDNLGLYHCIFEVFRSGLRRGGRAQSLRGRMTGGEIRTLFNDGTQQAPALELYNSTSFCWYDIGTEGKGEQPQLKFTNCYHGEIYNLQLGSPNDIGDGVGNAIELYGCEDMLFEGRPSRSGVPAFSTSSVKILVLDANCKRNHFKRFQLNAAASSEITNNAAVTDGNIFETYNYLTGLEEYIGVDRQANYLRLQNVAALPTAGSSYRGWLARIEGGTGVADAFYICEKDASDVYAWRAL